MWLNHIQERAKTLELDVSEGFREDVGNHVVSWTIFDDDVTLRNSLTDEMEVHIDVLCTGMEF